MKNATQLWEDYALTFAFREGDPVSVAIDAIDVVRRTVISDLADEAERRCNENPDNEYHVEKWSDTCAWLRSLIGVMP